MAYEIEWAESGITSLVDTIEYIARDSPSYAAALVVRADRVATSLRSSLIAEDVSLSSMIRQFAN